MNINISGAGMSMLTINMAADAIKNGKKVMHFTVECPVDEYTDKYSDDSRETTIDKARWLIVSRNRIDNSPIVKYLREGLASNAFREPFYDLPLRQIMAADLVIDLKGGKVIKNRYGATSDWESYRLK